MGVGGLFGCVGGRGVRREGGMGGRIVLGSCGIAEWGVFVMVC